ncbi:MAG: EamA family transporter [Nanoarchaeota archaeon]|nr:EamA family transporter [Nanoarchaeota archaeon]MBU1623091.1 EamA family transporter [Nanoarchaeota archaeon]MBU1974169.1 EamA family transporter [Nanoarchaeota archaeon]
MVEFIPLLLVLVGSFIGAIGTFIIKKGTNKHNFFRLWKSKYLWGGFVFYAVSVLLYIIALDQEELSVLYPLVSTAYIWTTLFSVKYLGEKMNNYKWLALVGIIIGISLIGIGS